MHIKGAEQPVGLKFATPKFVIHMFKRIPKESLQFATVLKVCLTRHMLLKKTFKTLRVSFAILDLEST